MENQDDLQTLHSEGIQIWGTSTEVLEKQALDELEIFVEENSDNKKELSNKLAAHIIDGHSTQEAQQTTPEDNVSKDEEHILVYYEEDEDSDFVPSEYEDADEEYIPEEAPTKKHERKSIKKKAVPTLRKVAVDDAIESNYEARLKIYYERLEKEKEVLGLSQEEKKEYKSLKGGLKVSKNLWNKLYEYQKEGVFWLWQLHQQVTGGLLGDEMGLGKTVQIIAFLHALEYTKYASRHMQYVGVGPSIIVCPATVIHQWVKHFHEWSPEFRVVILHQSGSHQGQKSQLIKQVIRSSGILITTYQGVLKYKGNLCEHNWHYLILDEGHQIRNPSAKISVAVKEIRTPHRIMLTGSPMQNNLTELWSLFDFTNPGTLGNLSTFTEHFANPILQGGFANASAMQEATALTVASTLKHVITPYLLRRMKNDVKEHIQLPEKSEQVLFCSLTDHQRDIYKDYLMSEQVNNILGRGIKWKSDNFMRANMLMAITALRKVCNHPDLFIYDEESRESDSMSQDTKYGYYKKSGKMVVVSALLKIWKKQGHRTLLFSQGRTMMNIFETFLEEQGYKYLKMDGTTSISSRQSLIDKFNKDSSYDVFILTTRVGGLGVNLTGADRVIIYDPDWNPATDSQAKERAWRIGQERSVTVYRLLCAGTVEEKMYQRQVWKQLLSNKVLIDPTTNKFFKSSDLFDLFSLPESTQANPETTNIFKESRVRVQEKIEEKKKMKKDKKKKGTTEPVNLTFSSDKIQAMRDLAAQIAKNAFKKTDELPKQNAYQLELEEDRKRKLEEKEKLKTLTAPELVEYNRSKKPVFEDYTVNKIDDKVCDSFEKALEQSSKTANLYHKIITKEIKPSYIKSIVASTANSSSETIRKSDSKKKKRAESCIDTSGQIDGEKVEGLVGRQVKKRKKDKKSDVKTDNYILEHLFSKKGVSGALEHESVLNAGKKPISLKVRNYAEEKASQSLEALKLSKIKYRK